MTVTATYSPQNLFVGFLTDSAVSVLDAIVADHVVLVHGIHLHNTSADFRVVSIQHSDGAEIFQTERIELSAYETRYLEFGNEGRAFNTGHELLLYADAPSVVNADISGSDRTSTTC